MRWTSNSVIKQNSSLKVEPPPKPRVPRILLTVDYVGKGVLESQEAIDYTYCSPEFPTASRRCAQESVLRMETQTCRVTVPIITSLPLPLLFVKPINDLIYFLSSKWKNLKVRPKSFAFWPNTLKLYVAANLNLSLFVFHCTRKTLSIKLGQTSLF